MIITCGVNVFTAEVEATIVTRPDVLECAVVGVPDDTRGEALRAPRWAGRDRSVG